MLFVVLLFINLVFVNILNNEVLRKYYLVEEVNFRSVEIGLNCFCCFV